MKPKMQTLTTTIEGKYLRQIIDGTQNVEHRDIKPYWDAKIAKYETPFLLRLINGMRSGAPEITVEVTKVVRYESKEQFWLYLGKIKSKKNIRNLIKTSKIRDSS